MVLMYMVGDVLIRLNFEILNKRCHTILITVNHANVTQGSGAKPKGK